MVCPVASANALFYPFGRFLPSWFCASTSLPSRGSTYPRQLSQRSSHRLKARLHHSTSSPAPTPPPSRSPRYRAVVKIHSNRTESSFFFVFTIFYQRLLCPVYRRLHAS